MILKKLLILTLNISFKYKNPSNTSDAYNTQKSNIILAWASTKNKS